MPIDLDQLHHRIMPLGSCPGGGPERTADQEGRTGPGLNYSPGE